jgi:hypothetical protein
MKKHDLTWKPIKSAPQDILVLVAWLKATHHKPTQTRHRIDIFQDGLWSLWREQMRDVIAHDVEVELKPPYTHWMHLPLLDGDADNKSQ